LPGIAKRKANGGAVPGLPYIFKSSMIADQPCACLMLLEHGGFAMMAWIAMRQALNRGEQATAPEPRKKLPKPPGSSMRTVWIRVD
jgi:hypothetical protein